MAIFNEILAPRYARALQKLFGIKGSVPVRQLAGEVSVAFPLFSGSENRFLETWDRFGNVQGPTGGAGQSAGVRFRNPANSRVIAVVELILISNPSAAAINVSLQRATTNTDLTTVVGLTNNRLPDARQPRSTPALILSTDTNAPATGITMLGGLILPVNGVLFPIQYEAQEFPISPGEAIQFQCNTLAVQMNAGIWWRERALEESETQ